MKFRLAPCMVRALAVFLGGSALAQVPAHAATVPATADSFATEVGGFCLSIPGVAQDFVLLADGVWQQRPDGTARLTASLHSASAVDRDLFVALEFSGLLQPGDANYPPAGAPTVTLDASAYIPLGPVDPLQWRYYTQVTGTLTGLRAFAGARIDVTSVTAAQLGLGATNKNVLDGLACDLALTIVQPPTAAGFAPTGPAQLRSNFTSDLDLCATHVDDDAQYSGTTGRTALQLPGVADDYLWLPSGSWHEADDGTATMTGMLRRQSDYTDAWQLDLQLANRIEPGDLAHPPLGSPVLLLLPAMYAAQGGPIDPAHWRYYPTVTGTLTGIELNDGGLLQLAASDAIQVGLAAGHGNVFFGVHGDLQVTVQQQPTSRSLAISGDAVLRANLATDCILPMPTIITGDGQTIDNVTNSTLLFTGQDLGFVAQVALGPYILGADGRRWFDGYFRVVDHDTIEVAVPQALPAATLPLTMLNPTRISNLVSVTLAEPTVRTFATEPDRLTGELQHFVVHQGDVQGFAFNFLLMSLSNQPSFAPGIADLQIGAQFSDLQILTVVVQDLVLRTSVVPVPIPALLQGIRVHWQAALMDQTIFPLLASNPRFTDYL